VLLTVAFFIKTKSVYQLKSNEVTVASVWQKNSLFF